MPSSMRSRIPRLTSAVPGRRTRETIVRLMRGLALLGSVAACSRAVSEVSPQAGAKGAAVSQAGDDTMSLSLKLNALNDTDVPIGAFYVDGTWGSTVASRIGSGGGQMICCASVPGKWHPGLTVTLRWQDDTLYKKDPDAMASWWFPSGSTSISPTDFYGCCFFRMTGSRCTHRNGCPVFRGSRKGCRRRTARVRSTSRV